MTGTCWGWAAYSVTVIGFLLPSMQAEWGVSADALGYLAGVGMIGMLAGSVVGGRLSDRFGRRRMLTLTMLYLSLVFCLSALAWNYPTLLGMRFFVGMGMGAILPAAGTLVSEFSPSRLRGMMMVLLNGFWGLGSTVAALVGYSLVLRFGWRPAMWFGALAALSALLVHFLLPESLRYLLEQGKTEQAAREAQRVRLGERVAESGEAPAAPANSGTPKAAARNNGGIWSPAYARVTASLWLMWFALNFIFQGVFIWLPTLLATIDFATGNAFLITLFISLGQLPGTLLAAFLADRGSRRRLVIWAMLALGATALLFPLSRAPAWVLGMGFLLMVFNGMSWGFGNPFSMELYPTHMRAAATGWATGVGRLGGVAAPLVVAWLIQAGGSMSLTFSILASAPLLATLVLAGMKQETTGRTLEEISGG
ncbi:MAG: MFS transporter [Anaerolineae bacterium]|nr:MFS transporter [Anaerolineae bacterium]